MKVGRRKKEDRKVLYKLLLTRAKNRLTRYKQTTNFHKQFQDSQFQNWLLDTISNMKLCYCEKAKIFEKIYHLILTNYLVTFFKFLWPSNNI